MVALSGGVGGAKLALGLSDLLGARLTVACNTGDDFEHLGVTIAPDFDTVLYTLAGLANLELGWGRADETWSFMETLEALGGETWFRLGDRDLALHALRTRWLADGATPSEIAAQLCAAFGVAAQLVPATEQRLRTIVETDEGALAFQDYFVRRRCAPRVSAIRFEGADVAVPAPALQAALSNNPAAVVICPSNPYLSLAPILAIVGIADALRGRSAPCVAVSPVVGGRAIKGPTTKIMAELGIEASAVEVARMLAPLIDVFVLDETDRELATAVANLGPRVVVEQTVMITRADKVDLARVALNAVGVTT